jgi:hypothetical protein
MLVGLGLVEQEIQVSLRMVLEVVRGRGEVRESQDLGND